MPRTPYGRIEDEIAKAFVAFEKEYMGRGPKESACHVLGDLVLIRLTGVLTPAEESLSQRPHGSRMLHDHHEARAQQLFGPIAALTERLLGNDCST
jgi:uncharacterized protein YbcI